MLLDPAQIRDDVAATARHCGAHRLALAYSGGLDSTVLLDILAAGAAPLRAVHIEHGLQGAQPAWLASVAENCSARGVALDIVSLSLDVDAGESTEAVAREARYAALADALDTDELLLVAQHRDDQAETLLLQLLRGAGPAGLAAMPAIAPLGDGVMARPLLGIDAAAIRRYAEERALRWFDDPSNADERFDRNYLRRCVMPGLLARWPAAAKTLSRAAGWQAEASELMDALAAADARRVARGSHVLDTVGLCRMGAVRRRNVLRFLVRAGGLAVPDARRLEAVGRLACGATARGQVRWPGGEARRYRDQLHLLPPLPSPPSSQWSGRPDAESAIVLPSGYGWLQFGAPALAGRDIECRFRRGGERVRPSAAGPSQSFAAWCQRRGIPPWQRTRLPLTFADGALIAVGARPSAAEWAALAPRWNDAPAGLAG